MINYPLYVAIIIDTRSAHAIPLPSKVSVQRLINKSEPVKYPFMKSEKSGAWNYDSQSNKLPEQKAHSAVLGWQFFTSKIESKSEEIR